MSTMNEQSDMIQFFLSEKGWEMKCMPESVQWTIRFHESNLFKPNETLFMSFEGLTGNEAFSLWFNSKPLPCYWSSEQIRTFMEAAIQGLRYGTLNTLSWVEFTERQDRYFHQDEEDREALAAEPPDWSNLVY